MGGRQEAIPSDVELERIVRASHELEADTVAFLSDMIQTPSVNPPGEYEAIHHLVRGKFEELGWETDVVFTPDDVLVNLGLDSVYPRPNVLGYVNRGEGSTIVLNAHLDTVPVHNHEAWRYDPFGAEIDGGRIYGRGANDAKGRIASYTLAARLLEAADLLPANATVVLAVTCDEETGGHAGPGYLVESGALEPDYAIVEGNCEEIWIGVSGVRQFEVMVHGKASHVGRAPDEGANAILGASRLLDAIEEYAEGLRQEPSDVPGVGHPTCVPSMIYGGVAVNVVPAACTISVDHRVPPDFDGEEVERAFTAVVEGVELLGGVTAAVEVTLRADPYLSKPDDPLVVAIASNARRVFGRQLQLVGIRGFSDGRFFAAAGANTINFGPGDSACNPHGTDENVSLQQVREAAAVVAASVVDIARL